MFDINYSIRNPIKSFPDYEIEIILNKYPNYENIPDKDKETEIQLKNIINNNINIYKKTIIPGFSKIMDFEDAFNFIKEDLCICSLNKLEKSLKNCLIEINEITLCEFIHYELQIEPTNNVLKHLTFYKNIVAVKPLPDFIIDGIFLKNMYDYIKDKNKEEGELFEENIFGFLYSYTKLINNKIDYEIAVEKKLINKEIISWIKWDMLKGEVLNSIMHKNKKISYRYNYYLLNRLRINQLHKIKFKTYLTNDTFKTTGDVLNNINIFSIIIFAMLALALTSAQVLLACDLNESERYFISKTFYIFSILSLFILIIFILFFLFNIFSRFVNLIKN